uniref:G-protein coupled receptors family 1 profile domain-containing protein n=1 Tax=Lepisosteus oculatus TaxID=7918 RepID=W5M267_LEPOC
MISLNLTVPLAVDFNKAEDYFIFIVNLLVATSSVLVAGSVVLGIICKKSLRDQNRFIFMLNTSISDTLSGVGGYYPVPPDCTSGGAPLSVCFALCDPTPTAFGLIFIYVLYVLSDTYQDGMLRRPVKMEFQYTQYTKILKIMYYYCFAVFIVTSNLFSQTLTFSRVHSFGKLRSLVLCAVLMAGSVVLGIICTKSLRGEPPGPERDSKKESLRLIIVVVVCFLALWTPRFYYIIVVQMTRSRYMFKNNASDPLAMMIRFTSTCTPGLYIWGSPALREAVLKTVWGRVCPPLR